MTDVERLQAAYARLRALGLSAAQAGAALQRARERLREAAKTAEEAAALRRPT